MRNRVINKYERQFFKIANIHGVSFVHTLRKKMIVPLLIVIIGFSVYQFTPQSSIERPPFLSFDREGPLVIAHRGGSDIAPENTMVAIENAEQLGVDIVEIDIHMTKDGHLVLIHDKTVNRTTDGTGYVHQLTLEEIQSLDAGYRYIGKNGDYDFRGKGVYIPTLEEAFDKFPNMKFIIELKHTNPKETHGTIAKKLWELIELYNMEDQVLVSSFNQSIIQSFDKHAKGQVALGTGRKEALRFVVAHKLNVQNLFKPTGHVISFPKKQRNINLFKKSFILGAKNLGMDIYYWTINEEETMREMINAGVDGIITDQPDILMEILKQKGYR